MSLIDVAYSVKTLQRLLFELLRFAYFTTGWQLPDTLGKMSRIS